MTSFTEFDLRLAEFDLRLAEFDLRFTEFWTRFTELWDPIYYPSTNQPQDPNPASFLIDQCSLRMSEKRSIVHPR